MGLHIYIIIARRKTDDFVLMITFNDFIYYADADVRQYGSSQRSTASTISFSHMKEIGNIVLFNFKHARCAHDTHQPAILYMYVQVVVV